MKRPASIFPKIAILILILFLAGCFPRTMTEQAVAVPPLSPTMPAAGEVVVTVLPVEPTQPAAETPQPVDIPTQAVVTETPETGQAPVSKWIAYLGEDGNLWLVNPASGELRQVTTDGTPMNGPGSGETLFYGEPKWSSDGAMLASERQLGTPVASGMEYTYSMLVYDVASQTAKTVLEGQQTSGFAWQPGTRQIAFALPVAQEYFAGRGGVDSSWARGIASVNVDTGEVTDLVRPERGLTLAQPVFSPDGTKVAFQEVYLMEGAGKFAIYDLATQTYASWDKPIGGFRWLPNSLDVVYDYLTYAPSGTESIYRNAFAGDGEMRLIPENEPNSYAYGPAVSPDGSQVAFVKETLQEGTTLSQVMVVSMQGGEPRALGEFEQAGNLQWSEDGKHLLLGAGPWFQGRQLGLLALSDGSFRPLATGVYASWQP